MSLVYNLAHHKYRSSEVRASDHCAKTISSIHIGDSDGAGIGEGEGRDGAVVRALALHP